MEESDVFTHMIKTYGPPQRDQTVTIQVVERYRDRLPGALLNFWDNYGWGHFKENYYWICDPGPFDSLLERIFKEDLQIVASDVTVVAYTAFNQIKAWHRSGRTVLIDMEKSEITIQNAASTFSPDTGRPYSDDFLVGCLINDEMTNDTEYFELACDLIGKPASGECLGYVPALQLGGQEALENLQRVKIIEHTAFLAQLGPLKLVELTGPRPGFPMGEIRAVRFLGPSGQ